MDQILIKEKIHNRWWENRTNRKFIWNSHRSL